MILEIKTTAANQKVNLGYNLGRWATTATKPTTTVSGKLDWGDNSAVISFTGNEGFEDTSKLVHTYVKVGTYTIAVGGTVNWSQMYYSTAAGTPQNPSLSETLTRILLPTNNSPINNIDSYAFNGSKKLTSVPAGLIDKCINSTSIQSIFQNCAISTLDGAFFSKLTKLTNASYALYGTNISSINTNWFAKNTKLEYMDSCFSNCTKVTSISKEIFKGLTAIKGINAIFSSTSITNIPVDIFSYLTKTSITTLNSVFANTKITSIPSEVFDGFTRVYSFDYTFRNCASLKTLPTTLFPTQDSSIASHNFDYTFNGCISLTTIPSTFFNTIPAAKTHFIRFTGTFMDCTGLTSLPTLWEKYTDALIGSSQHLNCFTGCTKANNYSTAQSKNWA